MITKQENINKSYYAIIPANVRYSKIPPNAKLLYGEITALCNEKGCCWATNNYFAELYDVSKDTVSRWISILIKEEFIQSEIKRDSTGEITDRSLFICIDNNEGGYRQKDQGGIGKKINRGIGKKIKGNNTYINNTYNNINNNINNVQKEKIINNPIEESNSLFDQFWRAYPKKKSKGQAEKSWSKIKNKQETLNLILEALKWQVLDPSWNDKQFIPFPSTYLNAKKWEDEKPEISEDEYYKEYQSYDNPFTEFRKKYRGTMPEQDLNRLAHLLEDRYSR